MSFTKNILLGSAATLVAAVSAHAADLPSKKAAPAQYVKVCDAAGAGYFYIPGSDTCLKVGGYVEVDARGQNIKSSTPGYRAQNAFDISTDVEITLDTVTKTSYGDLTTHIGYEADSGASNSFNGNASAYIDQAYLTFAGLTAGRKETIFNHVESGYNHAMFNPDFKANGLWYTAAFGGGFSATIGIEDSTGNRAAVPVQQLGAFVPLAIFSPFGTQPVVNGGRAPDVVAELAVKQGWGEAGLDAGYHNAQYYHFDGYVAPNVIGTNKTANGWGLGAYTKINLPMLAAGDFIGFQVNVEQNALAWGGFTRSSQRFGGYNDFAFNSGTLSLSNQQVDYVEGHRQTGWNVIADFQHNWTPTVSTTIGGSYGEVRYANKDTLPGYDYNIATLPSSPITVGPAFDYNVWAVGQVTKWTPVKGLEFGIDTTYIRYDDKFNAYQSLIINEIGGKSKSDDLQVDFRVIRSF